MSYTYEEAVNYIFNLPKFTTKHSFDEGREFLERLGSPDRNLKVIHVAGTNGKGSVCAYMESILLHAGYRTGCFISPHLNDIRERIRLDGRMCSEEDFAEAFDTVYRISEELWVPTFFEYIFFMAMLIFKDKAPDVVILETGLGGRLDATNLVSDKLCSVITSIGLDHCEYLGDTVDQIAAEKAGISAGGRPLVYFKDTEGADAISRIASLKGSVEIALYKDIISDIHRDNSDIDFCLEYKYDSFICLKIRGRALYQVENAALAAFVLADRDITHLDVTPEDIAEGVYEMYWPGRMEEIIPGVMIDGAHNEPGIRAFLQSVAPDEATGRLLVFGCMADKAYNSEICLLSQSGLFDRIITVNIDSPRAERAGTVARRFTEAGCVDVTAVENLSDALEAVREYVEKDGYLAYITGSLYLVGEVRGLIL